MAFLQLSYQRPDGETDSYHLKAGRPYRVGRGSQCEVRILDVRMSREHARVVHDGQTWQLEDAGATNGVHLNGRKIAGTSVLRGGDSFRCGETVLRVVNISEHCSAAAPRVTAEFRKETLDSAKDSASVRAPDTAQSGTGLFLTLLGKRVGPLTREEARELKRRELRGELSEADLAGKIVPA